ncbi:MAG TPA: RluA family pseudouridine synthase [Anaerolineae bacterium]|nr:RluA family pseudouridine synthase [Anaerolineae bacterium]
MSDSQTFVTAEPMRLDQLLAGQWPEATREQIRALIRRGTVTVDGAPALKAGQYVPAGACIVAPAPEIGADKVAEATYSLPSLPVIYEDAVLIVVDKPVGLPLEAQRAAVDCVAARLTALYPEIAHVGGAGRAGIVTRIAPEASGLLLAARDEATYRMLRHHLQRQRIEPVYSVLVEGRMTGEHVIDQPVGNVKRARERLNVAREGRPARTCCRGQRHYKENDHSYSLLEVRPETSRKHQLRVHLAWYGFPIVGDRVYGSRYQPLLSERLFLHLSLLRFPHPVSGEWMQFESTLPPELRDVLRYLTRPKH